MTDTPTPGRRRRSDVLERRRTSRRARRRRSLLLGFVGLLGIVVIAGLVVVGARTLGLDPGAPDDAATDLALPGLPGDDDQATLLLATFDETDTEQVASQVVLLGEGVDGGATIVLVPATTVAEVPGHGPLQLGLAHALGAAPLLELSVDNLLGIDTDASIGVSRQAWAQFFSRFGGLDIDVPTSLITTDDDGQRQIRFEPGPQFLDGERVAEYLTFVQEGESELGRLPRLQRVLETLLDAIAEDPERLETVFDDGAPFLDTTEPGRFRDLLLLAADARSEGELDTFTLPVASIGSGDQSSYRLEADRAQALLDERFAASRPLADSESGGRRLQILNGNGEPGIGQAVAQRLQPAGYQVVLTRNADAFTYDRTMIIVYEDSAEQLALARDVQQRLGVGVVEVSLAPQRVTDITIVVGADFLER